MAIQITRTAWIDDDGSGTTGTVINNAEKTALYNQIDAALAGVQSAAGSIVQTITTTGATTITLTPGVTLLRCNNATLLTIQGLTAGVDGQELTLEAGGGQIDLVHASGSAASGTKLTLPITSGNASLVAPAGRAVFVYDSGSGVWRMKQHAQGAPIAPPYNAGAFAASGGTWTVDAGDILTWMYTLDAMRGVMTVFFYLANTTVGAGVSFLTISNAIWGGVTCPNYVPAPVYIQDPGGATVGYVQANGGSLSIFRGAGAFSTAANQTGIWGQVTFSVG